MIINNNWLIFGGLGITAIIALMVGKGSVGNTGSGSSYSSSSDYGSMSSGFTPSTPSYGVSSGYGAESSGYGSVTPSYGAPAAGFTGYGGRRTKRSKGKKMGTKRSKK